MSVPLSVNTPFKYVAVIFPVSVAASTSAAKRSAAPIVTVPPVIWISSLSSKVMLASTATALPFSVKETAPAFERIGLSVSGVMVKFVLAVSVPAPALSELASVISQSMVRVVLLRVGSSLLLEKVTLCKT